MTPWLLLLLACKHGDPDPLLDTGWFSALDADGRCVDRIDTTTPVVDTADWYWRSAVRVKALTELREMYSVEVFDAFGAPVTGTTTWAGLEATRSFSAPLAPDADYTLEAVDCEGRTVIPFRTSSLGQPLDIAPEDLRTRTYVFDLREATWVQPSDFGVLISLYFSTPILVGVQWASPQTIDLTGTMGVQLSNGDIAQDPRQATWNLPATTFEDAPYFEAHGEKISVSAQGSPLDIYNFEISGTFSADGKVLGGTRFAGLGDTRAMGEIIGKKGDEAAICDLAAAWGVQCEPCPDGHSTCMRLIAEDATGTLADGLALSYVAE